MVKNLVIVESPAKAKMIQKYLGHDFTVKASMGHIRDLPSKKSELPLSKQALPYASLAINIANGFEPIYVIKETKRKIVRDLKACMKDKPQLWIATDEDREGEAIGYHLATILKSKPSETKRIVFHEITKKAILHAMESPRSIDEHLFDAQQARRVLDRLVGYKLSPLIWSKIRYGLSAGRVQSVATRLIVEKEREIEAFQAEEFWKLKSYYSDPVFDAELSHINGRKLDHKKFKISSAEDMSQVIKELKGVDHRIRSIDQKDASSYPKAPFTTSTLQQEASSKLGFSVKQTMMIAQRLYEGNVKKKGVEGGFITYMRTDSFYLSEQATQQAKVEISKLFGEEYTLDTPRKFKTKSKSAQEAHEAIRPTNLSMTPQDAAEYLDMNQLRLYSLVWKRMMACQMAAARMKKTNVSISAGPHTFSAQGQIIIFPGYMKVYMDGSQHKSDRLDSKERFLPELKEGQVLTLSKILPREPTVGTVTGRGGDEHAREELSDLTDAQQKKYEQLMTAARLEPRVEGLIPSQNFSKAPARYTEASLVKKLESLGIGRPSTYAPTINTIQTRKYVEKREDKRLYATDTGKVVNDFLVKHFSDILSYDFTARIEEDLDEVAEGKVKWVDMIRKFYLPFQKELEEKKDAIKRYEVITEKTDIKCEDCGLDMEIKLGRFGKFLSCTGYPECKAARPINPDGSPGEVLKPKLIGETCPECDSELVERRGRYGLFVGCSSYPKCKYIKKDETKISLSCAVCGKGDIVEKKTRRGKIFFGCSRYPECNSAFWDKPIEKTCPICGDKQRMVKKINKKKKEVKEVCPVCEKVKKRGKKE